MAWTIKKSKAHIIQCKGMADGIICLYEVISKCRDTLQLTDEQFKLIEMVAYQQIISAALSATAVAEDDADLNMCEKVRSIAESINSNKESEDTEDAE